MRSFRYLKYSVGAAVIGFVIRHTTFLDGDGSPPPFINFAGGGDFVSLGDDLVKSLVARAALTATDRVLDVGSGIGRVAVALSKRYPALDYKGLEIVRYGVDWSCKRFKSLKTFRFQHADIYNSFYNPRGKIRASGYRLPQSDASRDLIIATSVFTHLPEAETVNYLAEFGRVLAKGGRVYLTTFLAGRRGREASFGFAHTSGAARIESLLEPDLAVAYDLEFWRARAQAVGLSLTGVYPGSWSPHDAELGPIGPEFQDTLILTKPN